MKVNQTGTSPAQNAEVSRNGKVDRTEQKDSKKSEKAAPSGESDAAASLSSRGKDMAKAKAAAAQAPEVREEKIAELKKRIAAGKYKVDETAIADRLVDSEASMRGIG